MLRFVVVGHGCRVDVLAGLGRDEVGDDEADKAGDRSPHSIGDFEAVEAGDPDDDCGDECAGATMPVLADGFVLMMCPFVGELFGADAEGLRVNVDERQAEEDEGEQEERRGEAEGDADDCDSGLHRHQSFPALRFFCSSRTMTDGFDTRPSTGVPSLRCSARPAPRSNTTIFRDAELSLQGFDDVRRTRALRPFPAGQQAGILGLERDGLE